MVIVWMEALAIGNEDIDNQHKEMFRRFNNFQWSCKQGKSHDELSNLLYFLGEYIRSHIALEELLQIKHDFPDYLKHKEQHDDFIRKFSKLEDKLNTKGITPTLLMQTNYLLVNWLTRHFIWTDRELANYLHTAIPNLQR